MAETVDHPAHYGGADNPYEVIKVMEAWLTPDEFRGALKFNIHKYLARSGKKGATLQDQQKAAWYAAYLAQWEARQHARDQGSRPRVRTTVPVSVGAGETT